MKQRTIIYLLWACMIIVFSWGCKKNFPSDRDSFSLDMNFSRMEYTPVLGRSTMYTGNFNNGESTLPLNFRISAVRRFDGKEAPELLKLFPVSIWKERYTGLEKSAAEIRAKRDTVMRPLWEIGEHSGSFTMWSTANSNILKVEPDSGYVFDVEVSSSGGRRYFRDLKLRPKMEVDYEASSYMYNFIGDSTRTVMRGVNVWFNRRGPGNSITFKMLKPDLSPLSLNNFRTTRWDELLHGFNLRFSPDSTTVTYDVEYPIPLAPTVPTKYLSGQDAFVQFSFDRIALGGQRIPYFIKIPFRIHRSGDWEVVIYFKDEAPLFTND